MTLCKEIAWQDERKQVTGNMRKISHKNIWNTGVAQVNVDTPITPLIKSKHNDKSDKDFVKLKLGTGPTSEKSGLYEFKTALLDNGDPEYFLFFPRNFNINLKASWTLVMDAKVQYLHTLLCG